MFKRIKEKKEERKLEQQQGRKKELFDYKSTKPEFSVVSVGEFQPIEPNEKSDINILMIPVANYDPRQKRFGYVKGSFDPKNWIGVKYYLKNTGKTKIERVIVGLNECKTHSIFSLNEPINTEINFTVEYNHSIEREEMISFQVCFKEDSVWEYGAALSFYLVDENGNWWEQSISAHARDIGYAEMTTQQIFEKNTNKEKLIDLYYIKPLRYPLRRRNKKTE